MAWRSQTFGPTYLYYLNRMSALSENQWGLGGKGNPGLPEERDPRIEGRGESEVWNQVGQEDVHI